MKKMTLKFMAGAARKAVDSGRKTLCISYLYQPKMPDELKKTDK